MNIIITGNETTTQNPGADEAAGREGVGPPRRHGDRALEMQPSSLAATRTSGVYHVPTFQAHVAARGFRSLWSAIQSRRAGDRGFCLAHASVPPLPVPHLVLARAVRCRTAFAVPVASAISTLRKFSVGHDHSQGHYKADIDTQVA